MGCRGEEVSERADTTVQAAKVAVVVGAGPGLGGAVARRFARGGYAVALMARHADALTSIEKEIVDAGGVALSVAADASDASSMAGAFATVRTQLGEPEVLVYNAGAFQPGGILEISVGAFESAWRSNCFGGFLAAREVLPAMVAKKRGTLLFTGATASRRGSARFAGLAVGKFGLRALAESTAREFGPQGIHVAHVVIDGQIDTPRMQAMMPGRDKNTLLSPDAIAETYWQLHTQEASSWTFELDVRPNTEKW
jgi:NAD(P)-dependent dehydrogenase (short-subunit alcohol dehydrogenase family)